MKSLCAERAKRAFAEKGSEALFHAEGEQVLISTWPFGIAVSPIPSGDITGSHRSSKGQMRVRKLTKIWKVSRSDNERVVTVRPANMGSPSDVSFWK